MTRKNNIKSLSLATGAALALGLSSGSAIADVSNPFAMSDLSQGYQVAGNNGKCGEAKCGGSKSTEAKCGEGKCGDSKKPKSKEAKCGEGKCGDSKKPKAKEAKCGEGKCGSK
ncbi:MAG: hypothetical protein OEZ38_13250 [Gammaproteobacteria bacterium]|nr:hypothetical protein [Gammaproteobacteria bacterium]